LTRPQIIYNNISSGKGLSINQILNKFRRVLKLNFEVRYKPGRKFDVKKNILDNRLALKFLKWKPETEFNDALVKTWRYTLDNE
jgi:UDP-glucose 4-epimerase